MFNGRLSNTQVADTPLARLSIGITGPDGARAEMKFVREAETTDLVAQVPESEIPNPTPDDLEAQYLSESVMALTATAFVQWLQTDAGRLISFEKNEKNKLAETFAAGYAAAVKAMRRAAKRAGE